MTRWLVTGAGGQLGHHVLARLRSDGADVNALTRAELDITAGDQVRDTISSLRPDVVVNAAAWTDVDRAEAEPLAAAAVNADGPRLLAGALAEHGGRLIHVSTDYVFDGTAERPYEPDDPTGPRTAYGRGKLAGEQAVLALLPARGHIVRTAWLFGGPGRNFVDTMRRLERERDHVDVVIDQHGSPTWAADLADGIVELGRANVPGGVLHYANAGQASWFDLARAVFERVGADPARVRPTTSAAFAAAAPRPAWSVLSTVSWTAAGLTAPRPWPDALAAALAG